MVKIKNDNRAFTLIELLAVIVLLALLALITTPNVLNIIEDSRRSAAEENARVIASTAENYYAQHTLLYDERVGEIDLESDILNYKGDKPYKGYVYFDDNGNAYIKMYQNGYCVIGDYDNTTKAVKMEAKECEIKALIIFIDLDGGKLEEGFFEFEQGDTYGELPTPTKDGYTFKGWFDKDGNPITPDTIIDESSTIYAQWEANIYTVTLSLPDGNIPVTEGWNIVNGAYTKEVTYDQEYGVLPQPTKEGYTFTGWYTGGGFKINPTSTLIIPNDHTLMGQFTPNTYKITYVYNNGNANTLQTVTYDTNYNLPEPTKTGYNFLGWYDGSTKIENNSVIKILSDKTYEAKWSANTYIVTFKYNDGVTNDTTKEVVYDSNYGELPNPTRIGYEFLGWYDNNTLITQDTKVQLLSNQTLTAKWDTNSYTVTFKYNDGVTNDTTKDVIYDSTYGTLPNPSRTGYTFNGWYLGSTKIESTTTVKITSNQTLEASWTANTYTVTYVYNNGSSNTTEKVTYNGSYTLPSPTKTGYVFQGWFTTGGVTITSDSKVTIASDHTISAVWSASGYTVTYNANGGSVTPGTAPITYDSTYGTLPTPSRTGYTFKGWYTAASGGTQVTASTKVTTAGNHSIYAQWNPITYKVAYNANGGSGSMTSVSHTYDTAKALTANAFTRTGYTFKNWNTLANGTGTSYANSASVKNLSTTNNATINLYAQWTANTYTVAYNANGGSGTMASVTHTYDTAKALTANAFTRTGYTFNGWNTVKGGTGTSYANSASVKNLTSTKGGTVTLYAQWKAKTFTVTYNYNGSGAANTTKTVTYDSTYILPTAPTRTNYKFLGWFTTASGGTQVTASTKVQITANQTLYAHWELTLYVTSLTLNTNSVTKQFKVNSSFNYTNLGVTANYSDGTTKTISSGYTVSTPAMSSGGSKTVTVSYSGVSATYTIQVGYYWNKYNTNKTYKYTRSTGSSTRIYPTDYDIYGYGFYDTFSSSTGEFDGYVCGIGSSWNDSSKCGSSSCDNVDGSTVGKGEYVWSTYEEVEWYVNDDYTDIYIVLDECDAGPWSDLYLVSYARSSYFVGYPITISQTVSSVTRGSYIGQVFSTSSSAYPSNSYSGSYWYVSA